jgi:hypothetical protein
MYFILTKIVFSKSLKHKLTFLFNAILNGVKNGMSAVDYHHLRILMVLLLIVSLKLERKE